MGDLVHVSVVIDGGSVVERETRMGASGARTRVSMIPSSFDLAGVRRDVPDVQRTAPALDLAAVARHPRVR